MRCHERILDPQGVLVRGKDTRNCLSARKDKEGDGCLEARTGPLTRSGPPAPGLDSQLQNTKNGNVYNHRQPLSAALQALQFIITQL